jgi:hypothetical protein
MISKSAAAVLVLSTLAFAAAEASAEGRTERVRFKAGTTFATISGSITGYDTNNYLIGASAGQVVSVLFNATRNACYFNFIEPGANSAIHMGEVAGNEYAARLSKTGDYRTEVYMMRSDARRGKTCNYSFTIEISGNAGAGSSGNASSAESMKATCRSRAHEILRARLPNIETKYEGQRADGTHAVNGTAFVAGRAETFQCSFNRSGSKIVGFVVNH